MPWTILSRVAGSGLLKPCSIIVLFALCAPLVAMSVLLTASTTAQACGITRHIHNKTDLDIFVEVWRGGGRQWASTEPLKPGATLSLEYIHVGESLMLTGPKPARAWRSNSFGAILDIHRCNQIRISGESKLGGYEVKVSLPANADISIRGKR